MTEYSKQKLIETKRKVIGEVEEGKLSVKAGASLLGITRQGLWKLRKQYRQYGNRVLGGRKRGPKQYHRVWNRTPEWVEEKIEKIYLQYGGGPDTLSWIIEDYYHDELGLISLSRSTIYRILVRRRLMGRVTDNLTQKQKRRLKHPHKYTKGYPGEEVQVDTTEPFGKGNGWMINFIDDYTRWKVSYFYTHNTALNAKLAFQRFIEIAPFPVQAIRTDNGSEFKKEFQQYCYQQGIRLIKNPPHTPEHNGKVERLHRTVEEECLWWIPRKYRNANTPANIEYVNYALAKHSLWYNTKRRHLGYKMNCTPFQKLEAWIINTKTNPMYEGEVNETMILYIIF